MFWDSVCPSFTGNTLSSTNWLSPLLGGHCCLRSSIQKLFTFSVLQDRGLVLKELSSVSDSSEDTRLTWGAENRPPSLSSSVTAFSLLSSFYIQKREREKNSVIQLIFCIKHHMATQKLLLYWLSEPQHCCKKLTLSER